MYTRMLAALAFAVGFTHAAIAASVEATLSLRVAGTHPLQAHGTEAWVKSSKKASNREVDLKAFPPQQLGAVADRYDMASSASACS
jgi:TRAP-type C4-dicarboxylate transport system substrate-binding protein